MIVIIERRLLSLFVRDERGMHRRMVFAEMDEMRARALVREYGCKPEWVYGALHGCVEYRHEVDDSLVATVMDRYPRLDRHREADWLRAVRTIVPQAKRIVRRRGGRLKEVVYEQ